MKGQRIIFKSLEMVGRRYQGPSLKVTADVWIDAELLGELLMKAAKNKGRKAKDGPLFVEVLKAEEVPDDEQKPN